MTQEERRDWAPDLAVALGLMAVALFFAGRSPRVAASAAACGVVVLGWRIYVDWPGPNGLWARGWQVVLGFTFAGGPFGVGLAVAGVDSDIEVFLLGTACLAGFIAAKTLHWKNEALRQKDFASGALLAVPAIMSSALSVAEPVQAATLAALAIPMAALGYAVGRR